MDAQELDDWISSLLLTHSIRWIAAHVHIGRKRVRAVRNARHAGLQLLYQLGPPIKATHDVKHQIIELTIAHPTFSDLQLATLLHEDSGIAVSRCTINRARHFAHFSYLPPEKYQVLTEQQRWQRMQFARDFRTGKLPWGFWIFCDESRFAMEPDDHRVWRRRGEYSEGPFAETNKYTKISIQVSAAIASGFKPSLSFSRKMLIRPITLIGFQKKWVL
jgi:transposase